MLVFLHTLLVLRATLIEWLLRRLRGTDIPAVENVEEEQATALYDDEKGVVFIPPVYAQRYAAVTDILCDTRWSGRLEKVADLGFCDTSFIKYLKEVPGVKTILGVDVETQPLAHDVLHNDRFTSKRDEPLKVILFQGNAADPDYRLIGCDAVISIEMVEHMLPHDLERLVHTVFGFIKPWVAIFTTPNADFNVLFNNMLPNGFRHWDHNFEWTRDQFNDWCSNIVLRYPDYTVESRGVGAGPPDTSHLGCCTQLALFINKDYRKRADLTADTLAAVTKIVPTISGDVSSICIDLKELSCTMGAVKQFSDKTHRLMSETKLESLLRTREVIAELKHLTQMLNLNRGTQSVAEKTTIWNNINWGENAPYWNQYYTIVKEYEFPVQTRSEDQRILELVSDEIHRLVDAVYEEDWFVDSGVARIPLDQLMHVVTHFTKDKRVVKELLEWNGFDVTEDTVLYSRLVGDDNSSFGDSQDQPLQFHVK